MCQLLLYTALSTVWGIISWWDSFGTFNYSVQELIMTLKIITCLSFSLSFSLSLFFFLLQGMVSLLVIFVHMYQPKSIASQIRSALRIEWFLKEFTEPPHPDNMGSRKKSSSFFGRKPHLQGSKVKSTFAAGPLFLLAQIVHWSSLASSKCSALSGRCQLGSWVEPWGSALLGSPSGKLWSVRRSCEQVGVFRPAPPWNPPLLLTPSVCSHSFGTNHRALSFVPSDIRIVGFLRNFFLVPQ